MKTKSLLRKRSKTSVCLFLIGLIHNNIIACVEIKKNHMQTGVVCYAQYDMNAIL